MTAPGEVYEGARHIQVCRAHPIRTQRARTKSAKRAGTIYSSLTCAQRHWYLKSTNDVYYNLLCCIFKGSVWESEKLILNDGRWFTTLLM